LDTDNPLIYWIVAGIAFFIGGWPLSLVAFIATAVVMDRLRARAG